MVEYTHDSFQCGVCGTQFDNIVEYADHMIIQEKCTMVLLQCTALHHLLLPRFLSNDSPLTDTDSAEDGAVKPTQVFCGNSIRWKCPACALTFSREAAFANHYSLLHRDSTRSSQTKSALVNKKRSAIDLTRKSKKLKLEITEKNDISDICINHDIDNECEKYQYDDNDHLRPIIIGEQRCDRIKVVNAKEMISRNDDNYFNTLQLENHCTEAQHTDIISPLPASLGAHINGLPENNDDSGDLNSKPLSTITVNPSITKAAVLEQMGEDTMEDVDVPPELVDLEQEQVYDVHDEDNDEDDIRSIYGTDELSCNLCCQTFKNKRTLQQHINIVHAVSKPFVCSVPNCIQAFKTKGSLTRHFRRHTDERPFVCGVCGRSFRESGTLHRHRQCKVSCALKTDAQLTRYRATLPLITQDSKANVACLLKQEVAEERLQRVPDGQDLPSGRIIKQERDVKVNPRRPPLHSSPLSIQPPTPTSPILPVSQQQSLLSIKQEGGRAVSIPSCVPLNLRCKKEFLHPPSDDEPLPEDDWSPLGLPISPLQAPDSPSSIASLNPSLVDVPAMFPMLDSRPGQVEEELLDDNPNEWCDIKPRLYASVCGDVKPRFTADIKPRMCGQSSPVSPASDHNSECEDVVCSNRYEMGVVADTGEQQSGTAVNEADKCVLNNGKVERRVEQVMEPALHKIENESHVVQYGEDNFQPPPQCVYNCMHCSKSYKSRSALMNHLYTHADKLGPQCSECNRSFSTRQGVVRHIVRHSSVRRFLCTTCPGQFSHMSQLQQHQLTHSRTKAVMCDICGRAFKTVSSRNLHARSHTGVREVCEVCGREFSTKGSLHRHRRTHTGARPYSCIHCKLAFRDTGTLARHLKNKKPCCLLSKSATNQEILVNKDNVNTTDENKEAQQTPLHEFSSVAVFESNNTESEQPTLSQCNIQLLDSPSSPDSSVDQLLQGVIGDSVLSCNHGNKSLFASTSVAGAQQLKMPYAVNTVTATSSQIDVHDDNAAQTYTLIFSSTDKFS